MFLILGLGNPGPRYELTRHNAGFLVVDHLAAKHRIPLTHHKYRCQYGEGEICGARVMVAKPMTYMNESGKSAKAILSALQIKPERIIVVYDEIDLPLGKIKIRTKGGDAGQRGLRSIIELLGTGEFYRVRVGIGRPEHRDEIVDYVLSPFEEEEVETFNDVIEQAVRVIESTLSELKNRTLQTEE
ncbi:MAG: peptidyl-tRNA hydrolase [Nitrospinaceae bacterium]|nr:MAG: peptidyl-tRNA hydrolase [Nitrospinaceae bacterium]